MELFLTDNSYAADNPICRKHGIDGTKWIWLWMARMLRHPDKSLPLLFLFSILEDSCGKSTFLKILTWLFKAQRGVADVYLALTEPYNLALYGAVLGVIEEQELDWNGWLKLKRIIEAERLTIRPMQRNTFQATNYLHFVITTNLLNSLPLNGRVQESRIVFVDVPEIPEEHRHDFNENNGEQRLKEEIPHVLHTLMNEIVLPPKLGRLYLPVLKTGFRARVLGIDDRAASADDRNNLAQFLDATFVRDTTAFVLHKQFVERWKQYGGTPPDRDTLKTVLKEHQLKLRQKQVDDGTRKYVVEGIRPV